MYAVIKTGGKQYRVQPGDVLVVEKLDGEPGANVSFGEVLMLGWMDDEALRRTLADARAGASLVQALEGLANRTTLPSLARFVDGVVVAVERGTPLADVLRAQAQDVREQGRRELMEAGGKKEIAMMIPVVFLVLPVTVLFAIYPGLAVLSLDL